MKMAVRHQRNTLLTKVNFRNFGCLHHCRFGENKYLVLFLNLFQIYLDDKNEIKSSECDCPRGAFKCSHAACVFVYGIWNLSRTDVECTWKKRKTTSLSQTSIEEMFPPKKDYECLKRKPSQEDRTELYSQLRQYGRFTGLCCLMSAEPQPPKQLAVPIIEEIIFSEEFMSFPTDNEQIEYLKSKVAVDLDTVKKISYLTSGQRSNPSWHLVRKGRLTASNFGCVLNAKRTTPSLIKRLLGEYDISRVKAVAWGVTNEEEAIKAFEEKTKLQVIETGVWLDESGVLGASPDGLVGEDHVVEVKCPYTHRNQTLDESLKHKTFCLKQVDNGKYELKRDHVYWHQVQGQIYLTQRNFCYFIVWTTTWCVVIEIPKDPAWGVNLRKLTEFYFTQIFPKIVEGEL